MVLGFLEEGPVLSLLMLHGFDKGAKSFVGRAHFELFDWEEASDLTGQFDGLIGLVCLKHWSAAHREGPFN